MAPGNDTLRLMIVDDHVEDAEAIVSTLRNAGITVRPSRPSSAEELAQMLEKPVDMVMAYDKAAQIPFAQVVQSVSSSSKDVPILALLNELNEDILVNILQAGATRIALRHKPVQMLIAVRTEWQDVEARRQLRRYEAQVRETERRCDALIESSRDPIAYVHEGMFIRSNSAFLEMFGFESDEDIEGMSLLDLVASSHVDGFKALLKSLGKGEAPPPRHELTAIDASGGEFPAVMEFTQAMYEGEPCVQIVFRRQELLADPELAREVEALRQRDQVTGLFNRTTFLQHLENAIGAVVDGQARYGVLLLEPDHYQTQLQTAGLNHADEFLLAVASRVQDALGADAVAARFGEHTLAVLVQGDHTVTEGAAATILRAFTSDVFEIGNHSMPVTASIGGVQIGEKNASLNQVLGKANERLQSALSLGGNRSDIFDPGAVDRAEVERIQQWVLRLRQAMAEDHFLFHYQPVISLQDEPGAVYETYLRLDAGGELLQPRSFLPIAEENGLQGELDRWVIRHAIQVIAERQQANKPVTLLAKISDDSLVDPGLADYVAQMLQTYVVSGERLILQLVESKVFSRLRETQALSEALGKLGVRICINQFGSGLDSAQLLNHFRPAMLKVDRSFTEDLARNTQNQERIREITARAQELYVKTMAEFVQDAASMTILFMAGMDFVQGDFLAPAGPLMNYDFP
ncbi:MAG: PAS domain S-box protein [Pseudoxanthomonas suwonensis]|nr:MAG: PAS domain S-box protein [Pseudoxanthomonas suwonensis]